MGQGVWIEQATDIETTDNQFLEGGDDCIGYAKKNTQYIYFFDVNVHKWTTVDLQNEQVFHRMAAKGKVIIAYTDDYLIGYSSITSGFDTIRYESQPLYPHPNNLENCSYGCIDRLGFFVTYNFIYIFDGELGNWQSFPYPSHPYDDGAIIFMRGDDYIGMIIPDHNDPQNFVTNMAYSLPQHDIASVDNAGYFDQLGFNMTHGFVTWLFPTSINNVLLTGYCSATNTFSQIIIQEADQYNFHVGLWAFSNENIEKNVLAFVHYISDYNLIHQNFHAYSTLTGSWDSKIDAYTFDPMDESGFSAFDQGGSIAASVNVTYETDKTNYYVYNGKTGIFHNLGGDYLSFDNGRANPQCVNNLMIAYDSTRVWIYNPDANGAYFANGFFDPLNDFIIGNRFIAVNMWDLSSGLPHDKLHIYNTELNKAIVVELDVHHEVVYPHVSNDLLAFAPPLPNNNEIYFYSDINDSLSHASFGISNQVQFIDVKGQIGVAFSSNGSETYLYDANTSALTLLTTSFSGNLTGGNFFMFQDGETMNVYNFTKQEFSQIQMVDMGNFWVGDTIGLVSNAQKKDYSAYNGFFNNWVALKAEGQWTYNTQAFNKTAVVARRDRLYAFDPFLTSGIPETIKQGNLNSFSLMQNHPNPFTNNTTISYSLTKPGHIRLTISNIIGNKVAVLVDGNKKAGEYQINYEPFTLAKGVYYCTLNFNNLIKTKKMVLIK
jgi:hypothetical protein